MRYYRDWLILIKYSRIVTFRYALILDQNFIPYRKGKKNLKMTETYEILLTETGNFKERRSEQGGMVSSPSVPKKDNALANEIQTLH